MKHVERTLARLRGEGPLSLRVVTTISDLGTLALPARRGATQDLLTSLLVELNVEQTKFTIRDKATDKFIKLNDRILKLAARLVSGRGFRCEIVPNDDIGNLRALKIVPHHQSGGVIAEFARNVSRWGMGLHYDPAKLSILECEAFYTPASDRFSINRVIGLSHKDFFGDQLAAITFHEFCHSLSDVHPKVSSEKHLRTVFQDLERLQTNTGPYPTFPFEELVVQFLTLAYQVSRLSVDGAQRFEWQNNQVEIIDNLEKVTGPILAIHTSAAKGISQLGSVLIALGDEGARRKLKFSKRYGNNGELCIGVQGIENQPNTEIWLSASADPRFSSMLIQQPVGGVSMTFRFSPKSGELIGRLCQRQNDSGHALIQTPLMKALLHEITDQSNAMTDLLDSFARKMGRLFKATDEFCIQQQDPGVRDRHQEYVAYWALVWEELPKIIPACQELFPHYMKAIKETWPADTAIREG